MKKLIFRIGLVAMVLTMGLATASFKSNDLNQVSQETSSDARCHYGQCQAIAKSTGNQCKHCVSNEGDSYCYQHK
jgi:hypothetical protein